MLRMILIAAAVAVILILLFAPGKKTPPPKTGRRSEPQYPGSNDVTQHICTENTVSANEKVRNKPWQTL